ncbi:DUF5658 family protein [Acidianus sp. HS-5]|uniref:DUF5658 family protein n=1 Tax=Acidianus sp. HS-5 TaxID=2886040 RepID=UPI001F198611|nr:DUF5658 family protein [Acidianus sp. HS-5]BDC17534.1 hypothetical protein HS5_04240 [Acidianus sp. HS-5]
MIPPYNILLFYGFQFDDYFTTILGLKLGAEEMNPFASSLINPFILAMYKFGLSTLALLLAVMFPELEILIYADTILESIITSNNIYALYKAKKKIYK